MQDLVSAISTVGFPIVAFLLMFWLVKTEIKESRDVVNNNTTTLATLIEHFHNTDGNGHGD